MRRRGLLRAAARPAPQGRSSHASRTIKSGNDDRIAVLSVLCYDQHTDELEGLSVLLDVDWIG